MSRIMLNRVKDGIALLALITLIVWAIADLGEKSDRACEDRQVIIETLDRFIVQGSKMFLAAGVDEKVLAKGSAPLIEQVGLLRERQKNLDCPTPKPNGRVPLER